MARSATSVSVSNTITRLALDVIRGGSGGDTGLYLTACNYPLLNLPNRDGVDWLNQPDGALPHGFGPVENCAVGAVVVY